jgi:hypothetical protein
MREEKRRDEKRGKGTRSEIKRYEQTLFGIPSER